MHEPTTDTARSERRDAKREGPRHRRRWAARVLALLTCIVLAELLLRGALILRVHLDPPTNCGLRPELLARLLYVYSSRPSSPSADGGGLVPDARRGYRNAPGLREREMQDTVVSTNSRGVRGSREYAVPKPPSVVRIVAIGDSVTYGVGVPDDATWPAQLEGMLPGTEVINLGEPAYAHDQMYFALSDDGMAVRASVPAVVR